MSWPKRVRDAIKRLNFIHDGLKGRFTDRDQAVDLLGLATVCRENMLIVGPPGTAKTDIITRYAEMLDMQGFHYLLSRFTEPSELFGPVDLEAFQKGTYRVRTEGMLPEADIVFLDEVFQGSSAILNSLLAILNERIFHNGAERQRVPVVTVVGATNTVPDDASLRAFADRFVLRIRLDRVEDELVPDLIEKGWALEAERIREASGEATDREQSYVKAEDVRCLHGRLCEIKTADLRAEYARLVCQIRAEGVEFSDRRALKGLKLVTGAALLRGSDTAEIQDLWPLRHIWVRPEEAAGIRNIIDPRLADAGVILARATRPATEIVTDLDILHGQEADLASEAAVGAHLVSLNKLRREILIDHAGVRELLDPVEQAIQRVMEKLEVSHV